jgi:hypothetical protein
MLEGSGRDLFKTHPGVYLEGLKTTKKLKLGFSVSGPGFEHKVTGI